MGCGNSNNNKGNKVEDPGRVKNKKNTENINMVLGNVVPT